MSLKTLLTVILPLALILFACASFAENAEGESAPPPVEPEETAAEDIRAEIERRAGELELSGWQSYFEELQPFGSSGTVRELIERCSGARGLAPNSLWQTAKELAISALRNVRGTVAALTLAGILTGLAEIMPEGGVRRTASFMLSAVSAALIASAFSSLCSAAAGLLGRTAGFTEAALPVMTVLLSAVGAEASSGALRPLMLFLSGSLIPFAEKLLIPLILAGGIVGILDGVTGSGSLSGIFRLISSAVKWILAIAAVLYTGVCAAQGMTAAAVDGVSIRTAKFAADRLLPSTGGLIGGSIDTMLSCALLVKNGAGLAAIVIMLGLLAKPLVTLGAGAFAFRLSAALIRPVSSAGTYGMLSNAAEMTTHLFAAAAVAGAMFAVTMLVFITAGGVSAGLW